MTPTRIAPLMVRFSAAQSDGCRLWFSLLPSRQSELPALELSRVGIDLGWRVSALVRYSVCLVPGPWVRLPRPGAMWVAPRYVPRGGDGCFTGNIGGSAAPFWLTNSLESLPYLILSVLTVTDCERRVLL